MKKILSFLIAAGSLLFSSFLLGDTPEAQDANYKRPVKKVYIDVRSTYEAKILPLKIKCKGGKIASDSGTACITEDEWGKRELPTKGISGYQPGELKYNQKSGRPDTWTIEYDKDGLDLSAYYSIIRSPYIQNISSHGATILWRVSAPLDIEPNDIKATVWIAPQDQQIENGKIYKTPNDIKAYYAYDTYLYEDGVSLNSPEADDGKDNYYLDNLSDRPIIGLRLDISDLEPDTIYHYRVESETVNPSIHDGKLGTYRLAHNVYFRTFPSEAASLRFITMGDLGPGNAQPSYAYDVFDLFHDTARKYDVKIWALLGDVDNNNDGHPNAADPFFFNIYNAYHNQLDLNSPNHPSSDVKDSAKVTSVKAFKLPPYTGLLGGLPVYPTFGNHDICTENGGNMSQWQKFYLGNFTLPIFPDFVFPNDYFYAAKTFNDTGKGLFYTYRYGDVVFISLGIPKEECTIDGSGRSWNEEWGNVQLSALDNYLEALQDEAQQNSFWIIVYFHDNNYLDQNNTYKDIFLKYGVDMVMAGHDHDFSDWTVKDIGGKDYQAVVVGTGGFGDNYGDPVNRPGFILVEINGNVLKYWKFDTHPCDLSGKPAKRDDFEPRIREYRKIRKESLGIHLISKPSDGNDLY